MKISVSKLWKANKSRILFIALMFVFRSAFADWNTVPTGSMKPTILEGDRILVNKMAYDLRIPFTHIPLIKISDPIRGDIAVFDSKVVGKKLVKRVIGVPGDTIELQNNELHINGQKLSYTNISDNDLYQDRIEDIGGVEHYIKVSKYSSKSSNFKSVVVPPGLYLVLGDNRDNSADSRFIGLVPRDEIVGRTKTVVLSLNYDNYYIPRSERFLHTL